MPLGFSPAPKQAEVDPYILRLQELEKKAKALRELIAITTPADGEAPGIYVPVLDILLGPGGKVETAEGKTFKFSSLSTHRDHLKRIAGRGYKWTPTERVSYLPLMREELSEETVLQLTALLEVALQKASSRDNVFLPHLDALWNEARELAITEEFEQAARAVALVWPDTRINRFYADTVGEKLYRELTVAVEAAKRKGKSKK